MGDEEGIEISTRTFWAGPSDTSAHQDSTSGEERKISAPPGVVALPLPPGQRPFPVSTGDWFLRVVAYRASEGGTADQVFILVCDQVLDENDRYLYLTYVDGGRTEGVVRLERHARYFRLRPPSNLLTFKLIPARPAVAEAKAPKFQVGIELSQRAGRRRYLEP